ncbi:MAG: PAS domain S-box protein [Candidatus Aminicenantes bacterium]|nr:MAG: PAS domain S-box protein [Candidatus Aminicenantes bacterium]
MSKQTKPIDVAKLRKKIVDLEKSQERLQEYEEKYKKIVELNPCGIVIVDLKGKVVFCNRAAVDYTGFNEEEIIGKKFTRLPYLRKKDIPKYIKIFGSLLKGKRSKPLKVNWVHKDGTLHTAVAHIDFIRKKRKISGLVSIAQDISEQKKVEETLQVSKERYSSLFHQSNDAIFIHDMRGNILDVNKKTLELFGYKKTDMLSLKIPDLHPRNELEVSQNAFQSIAKKGFVNFESQFKKKSGEVFYAEVSSSLFEAEGEKLIQGVVRDITERKLADEALRKSEMRYRALFEFANDAVFIMSPGGEQLLVNNKAADMLGYTIKELSGKHFKDIIASYEYKDAKNKLQGLLKGKSYDSYERIAMRKDGTEFPVEVKATLIRNLEREPLFIQSVVQDISERKKTEETLKESREMYKTLVETSPDAVTMTDLEGNITYVSRRTLQIHGYDNAEELIGKNAFAFIAPEDQKRAMENLKKTLAEGTVRHLEYTMLRKDGTQFIGELNASLIKDVKGEPKAFIAITRDITERKRAEQELSDSEKKFRGVVENATDAIYIITSEGFEYVNSAFERLTGYATKDVCKESFNFWSIIHPEDVKMIRDREDARRKGKEVPSRYEFRILAKDGKTKFVEPATVHIGQKGELKVMGILRDVTDRRQAEERIKSSLHEKDVLLREIHHRVKNNMQIISSLLRLQSRLIGDDELIEMFKESQNRIRSMALIHEKLYQTEDFAKINFAEYIRSLTVHLFHTYKVNPNIVRMNADVQNVFLDINKAIPCGLIINELVSNSLKHAFPDNKKGEICIKLSSSKQKTKIIVSDTGIGLPRGVNFREPETLGLQLVSDLVEQIEGTIRLERAKGTTFYISF